MLLIECPNCKKRISEKTKDCRTVTGSGCGTPLPLRQRIYWVQYRVDGKSKTKKIGPSRSAAVNYERKVKVEIVENKYIDKKTGKESNVGNISCPTCHNAHQWSPLRKEKGSNKNLEGNATNSFLRNVSYNNICIDCHGMDALFRYKYYHDPEERVEPDAKRIKNLDQQFR